MTQTHIIFSLNKLQYAINSSVVEEVFLLPEINSIDNAPQDIIGVLNFRSQIVPIMDLNLRFGHPIEQGDINREIIVIRWQKWKVGLMVDRIIEVKDLPENLINRDISYGRERNIADIFVMGTIELDNNSIMLLDPETLIRHSEEIEQLERNLNIDSVDDFTGSKVLDKDTKTKTIDRPCLNFYESYFPNITPSNKNILQARAANLKLALVEETFGEQLPVAVIRLGREYFGFAVDIVQEFIKIDEIYPIPCCPQTLLGNINWRGDIITLFNLNNALRIEVDKSDREADAVVVKTKDILTGFLVNEVLDVIYLSSIDIRLSHTSGDEEFDRCSLGTTFYDQKPITILDINKIILAINN
jgi:purine-binding chemotaxis protein CheW